jgi:surfeit locus 1 family protein
VPAETGRVRGVPEPIMTTTREPLSISARGVAGSLALLLLAALCVHLGLWQLERHGQRAALNAVVAERSAGPAVTEPDLLLDTTGVVYHVAEVAGRFDHARSIVIPSRSLHGAPGVYLLTPLLVEGRSWAVLVNRGWVPAADATTIDLAGLEPEPEAALRGLLLPLPAPAGVRSTFATPAGAAPDLRPGIWFAHDEVALREAFPYSLAAVLLQRYGAGAEDRAPLAVPPPRLDEGPHLGYAVQWFGFAAIGVVGWLVLVMRGRRRPVPGPAAGE